MATGEIPAPGVFYGDKAKDEKTFRQWKKKCQRWFHALVLSGVAAQLKIVFVCYILTSLYCFQKHWKEESMLYNIL